MKSRRPSKVLERIVDIRLVQRSVTETNLAAADKALKLRQDERDDAAARLDETESRWAKTLSRGSISLHMASALGVAVLEDEKGLALAQEQVEHAKAERAETEARWKGALANEEAAVTLTKAAVRKEARRRDEAALQELADRMARRGMS